MSSNRSLENIANGFIAAQKINSLNKSSYRSFDGLPIGEAKGNLMREIISIVAEYSPDDYRSMISSSLSKCCTYTDAYRNLMRHIKSSDSRNSNPNDIINVISSIQPVLNNRNQHMLSKVMRIFEILNSN